jgi:hypothetical protein
VFYCVFSRVPRHTHTHTLTMCIFLSDETSTWKMFSVEHEQEKKDMLLIP